MEGQRVPDSVLGKMVDRRVKKKGLRPRVAASVIAVFWAVAVIVFGIVEHLVDPDTFDNVWLGMWWATQTVTTVGYGDVVPADTAGQLIATILMIGGLSLFAVITGFITSAFVARAQADSRAERDDPILAKIGQLEGQIAELRTELKLQRPAEPPQPR